VKALKGQLFKTIQTRWEQWESEINPHRLDEYSNTKKYRILYRICKAAVMLTCSNDSSHPKFSTTTVYLHKTRARILDEDPQLDGS
jgi:hypothetical protein